jgi:hypothetical protein
MKIEKLFIGLLGLSVAFFTLSISIWKKEALGFHFYDTYYVISSAYIAIFTVFLVQVNYILYKLIGHKEGIWNYWILVAHIILIILSLTLLTGVWFTLQYSVYWQSALIGWAALSLLFSELLIGLYFFLPERRIGTI